MTAKTRPCRRELEPTFPHPDSDREWAAVSARELKKMGFGRRRAGMNIADIHVVNSLPPIQIPACLTLEQWLEIMSNGA